MPSKTPKQAKFMRAIAHGWTPSRMKSPPSRAVAQEFMEADRKYSGGFAENRYQEGGEVVTDEALQKARAVADARLGNYKASKFTLGEDHSATQKLKESYLEAKHKALDMARRVGGGAGGGGGAGYWTGGLAAMNEAHAGYKRGSLDFKWQEGGDVDYEGNGMRRGGRTSRDGGGGIGLGGLSTESPYTAEEQAQRDAFLNMDITPRGVFSTGLYNIQQQNLPPPEPTIANATGTSVTGPSGRDVTVYSGPRGGGRRGGRGGGRRGGRRGGGGPGPGGPGTAPPRIIPTDPASYIGASAEEKEALKQSPYRDQLREHKANIESILGSARGGHVNYYQEGGAARPGHAEGPNPHEEGTHAWKYWESRFHKDPPPPPEVAEEEVEEPGFLERWFGAPPEPENIAKTEEYLESIGQAYGGRVGYQTGGLAMAAPRGGIPPWVEPVQGYQFGGISERGTAPSATPYRGVPGRAQAQFNRQRGAPGGGRRGLRGRMGQAQQAYGLPTRGAPQGGLAAMYGRAQQQQQAQAGGLPPGIDPRAVAADPQGYRAQVEAQRRLAESRGAPGGNRYPPGYNNEAGIAQGPIEGIDFSRQPGDVIYDDFTPGGGGGIHGRGRDYDPTGGRGTVPPWKQPPGRRRAPPPGKYPGGSGPYSPGGRDPRSFPAEGGGRSGTLGGPGYGPDPLGSAGPGGSLRGGPRVPPNMQGYLQKMRMQNRPPSGPVGGGGNRVGMQDQQGALSRALQRGTGRPPTSRRMAFGRGAQQ